MLVTPEGLLTLDYDKSLKKIRDYRDIFEEESQDYKLLNKVVRGCEEGKEHMTRENFANVCYEALSETNQRKYQYAVENLIRSNKKKKYEFQLPALYSARLAQVKTDGKTGQGKGNFKPNVSSMKRGTNRFQRPFQRKFGNTRFNNWGQNRPQGNQTTRQRGNSFFRGGRGQFRGSQRGAYRNWNARPQFIRPQQNNRLRGNWSNNPPRLAIGNREHNGKWGN